MIYWKNKNNKETYMEERTSRREIKYQEKRLSISCLLVEDLLFIVIIKMTFDSFVFLGGKKTCEERRNKKTKETIVFLNT